MGARSAGAITINGTYTNGPGSTTTILGTINNNNSFLLNAGGGANSDLELGSNVTLQGGGTVTMSNSGVRRQRHHLPSSRWLDPDQCKQHH